MELVLWLAVALPLVAALAVRVKPALTRFAALASAVPAAVLLVGAADGERTSTGLDWLPSSGLTVGLRLDALAAVMSATVAGIGLVVLIYSIGYFAGDPRRASALAGMLAFLAAMQGLVLADGYLAMLIFWELVGAASARLIAYARDDAAAAPGAVRAFLTTRTADIGFYVALLALFTATGSVAFGQDRPEGWLGMLVGVGLVTAAVGKSAQAPVQTWLSGAMAGPTPVSALLHSATMVAAGVYLLVRSETLLGGWPLELAGWIGAVTAVIAAAIALTQRDLKRVLAGSTASQLGLMFVGVAAGGPAVALFHLVTHAVGKAGLFLAAGIFQHARDSVELDELEGAGRDDPRAFAGFVVSALSIAAVPPLAAFWSKDHIAAAAEPNAAWFVLVLISAAGSAAYLLRPALILWRRSAARRTAVSGHRTMLMSLAILATASIVGGLLGTPIERLLDAPELPVSTASVLLGLLAVLAGGGVFLLRPVAPSAIVRAARREFYAAALQRMVIVAPVLGLSRVASHVERGLDRIVDGTGRAALVAARGSRWIEERAVDRAVDGLAHRIGREGARTRRLQSGRLHEYLRDAVIGGVALALVVAVASLT